MWNISHSRFKRLSNLNESMIPRQGPGNPTKTCIMNKCNNECFCLLYLCDPFVIIKLNKCCFNCLIIRISLSFYTSHKIYMHILFKPYILLKIDFWRFNQTFKKAVGFFNTKRIYFQRYTQFFRSWNYSKNVRNLLILMLTYSYQPP
jgi:hypothetical protein